LLYSIVIRCKVLYQDLDDRIYPSNYLTIALSPGKQISIDLKRNMQVNSILVVMTKAPVPGKVKTRLTPPLSHDDAAMLYKHFLQDRIEQMLLLDDVDKAIAYTPESAEPLFKAYATNQYAIFPQQGRNLGERMHCIFVEKFKEGYDSVVIVGCDSPDLPASIVLNAFGILEAETVDMVIGPAHDGGYYLIGLKSAYPDLFAGIDWGKNTVLSDTLKKATDLKIRLELLQFWSDVDEFADLVTFYNRYKKQDPGQYRTAIHTIAFLSQILETKYRMGNKAK
jgi:rSAM/selenodomain-associated transferase 1